MSDETTSPVANAAAALAVKNVTDEVDGLKRQVKALWATVIVVAVLVLVLVALTLLPRFGISVFGGGFRGGQRFNPQSGQGFQPGGQGFQPGGTQQQSPQGSAPSTQ
jgi:hypothetical protein